MKKSKIVVVFVAIIVVGLLGCWFFNKFFPSQRGEWSKNSLDNLDGDAIPASGWMDGSFWVTLDFPGKQQLCLDIKTNGQNSKNLKIPAVQGARAYFYPKAGTLADFFNEMTPALAEENIRQEKPYYIGHLYGNIKREGKDLFFVGESGKYLIPTKAILNKIFPTKEVPVQMNDPSALPYANILINLPEGILLTDGQGVFAMAKRKLFIVRSPEVFEAMGYKWEGIKQMDNIDKFLNPRTSSNYIDFKSAHPNGTIITKDGVYFLVWNEKLYRLTPEEQLEYFPEQPVVEIFQKKLEASCTSGENPDSVSCCVPDVDTRLNPPSYHPFLNTIVLDMGKIAYKNEIEKIDWQSKVAVNKENTLKRLNSLKNLVLYELGILK